MKDQKVQPVDSHEASGKKKRSRRRRKPRSLKGKSETTEKTPSKKHHDAPMTKRDLYFSLHCESVAIGNGASAVARVTVINWDGEVVLDTFVQVPVPVTDYRNTGISPDLIASSNRQAMTFAKVRLTVHQILKGKILVGYNLQEHLTALGLTHPFSDVRDAALFQSFQYEEIDGVSGERIVRERSLGDLSAEFLQCHYDEPLTPLEACNLALRLYKRFRKEWEESLTREARQKENEPMYTMASPHATQQASNQVYTHGRIRLNSYDHPISSFSDPSTPPRMTSSAHERATFHTSNEDTSFQPLETGLTSDALEMFTNSSHSVSPNSGYPFAYQASYHGFETSSNYGSSVHYEDSSVVSESYATESLASSIHEEVIMAPPEVSRQATTSSWFRFGNRKAKYASPSPREPMSSLTEEPDPVVPAGTLPTQRDTSGASVNDTEIQQEDGKQSSSWFSFSRRPKSPRLGKKTEDSDDERDQTPIKRRGSMGSLVRRGSLESVASASKASSRRDKEESGIPETIDTKKQSGSWFSFRRTTKSRRNSLELQRLEKVDSEEQPTVDTEHTVEVEEDWMREVAGSPGSMKKDVLDSSWLEGKGLEYDGTSIAEPPQIKKESTWLPRFMRYSRSSSMGSAREETGSVTKDQWTTTEASTPTTAGSSSPGQPVLNPSFFSPVESPDDEDLSMNFSRLDVVTAPRSRLESEITLPTVVSEEEFGNSFQNLNTGDFTPEFVPTSLAVLNA